MKLAIFGLGRMGARHVVAANNAGFELSAVFDPASDPFAFGPHPELRPLAAATSAEAYARGPDAAVIATTAPYHTPILREAIAAGIKRFVVEKPFTSDPREAFELLDLINASGVRVAVNHGRRYSRNYATVRNTWNGSEQWGRLRSVTITQGAGGLGCLGVHYLDLANYLFKSPPSRVYARLTTPLNGNPRGEQYVDPGGTVMMEYDDGGRATLEMGDDVGVLGQIELRFERGYIRIDNETAPWRAFARTEDSRDWPMGRYGAPVEPVAFDDFQVHTAECAAEDVQRDALGEGPLICGADVGAEVMATLACAHVSSQRGVPVDWPLDPAEMAIDANIP